MDDMVERVMSLCPECDPIEVERDLNLTGDVEWTLNRALDGMLSPKGSSLGSPIKTTPVTIIMDDEDLTEASTKFTNLKERSQLESSLDSNYQKKTKLSSNCTAKNTVVSKTTNKTESICLELSDSDSDASTSCGKTLEDFKSSLDRLKGPKSKTPTDISCSQSQSAASSSDSDSELFRPAFCYEETEDLSTKMLKVGRSSGSVIDVSKDCQNVPKTGVESVANVGDFRKKMELVEEDVCLAEPVRKKKRTKEEIEEKKREAMLKKAAKAKEREEKLQEKRRQKEARTAAIQEKKLRKEKHQLQKKAERLTKSANKLDGCLKFITVCLDPALLPDGAADPSTNVIVQNLTAMEANHVVIPQPYPGSVSWQRTAVKHSVQEGELAITTSDYRMEEHEVLVVLSAEQFAEMVLSFKQVCAGEIPESREEQPRTLVDFTKHVKNIYREKKVTFLLNGLEKYMRNVKLKQQRAFRTAAVGEPAEENGARKRRKKKTQPVLDVTWTDIEEALVDLQIKCNVCVYYCETEEDVAFKIALFTKAVAERPYKKSLADGLGFCLDRLDKTSLKVSKDGQGMVNVWRQQIQQFRNVSSDMAAAIIAEYPSPQLLKQAYEQCRSVQDAKLLLEDILVRRGGGSLATCRRIGPELSKRFYILFHSKENSDLVKG